MIVRDFVLALAVAVSLVLAFHIVVWMVTLVPVSNDEASCLQCVCWGVECPDED